MQNLGKKLFIYAVLSLAVWFFATANAQTTSISVWSPSAYGILNLNQAFFKNSSWVIWVVVDGTNRKIEIKSTDGQLRVNKICDQNWSNCKTVSTLWAGAWSSITVNGSNWFLCSKTNANTLSCSNIKVWTTFTNGKYCTYNTTNWLNCTSDAPTSITINGTQAWYLCTRWSNSTTLNCNTNVKLWSSFTNGWYCTYSSTNGITCSASAPTDNKWTLNSTNLYPANTSTNVAIWTTTSNNYKLNVVWSWRFSTRLDIWSGLNIDATKSISQYTLGQCNMNQYITYPTLTYANKLVLYNGNAANTIWCKQSYSMFGTGWNLWVWWDANDGNIKLSVYWHARFYANSARDQWLDISNTFENIDGVQTQISNIISRWSHMKIGLEWDYDYAWISLPWAYIRLTHNIVWINKVGTPWYYNNLYPTSTTNKPMATLQVNGWIQLWNNGITTNDSNQKWKKWYFYCVAENEWTIQYYDGNFYGCVKTSSGNHRWRKFDTSAFGNSLPVSPSHNDF